MMMIGLGRNVVLPFSVVGKARSLLKFDGDVKLLVINNHNTRTVVNETKKSAAITTFFALL